MQPNRSHDGRSEALALAARDGGDGLDVAGPNAVFGNLQTASDDRRVCDHTAAFLNHEMCPAQRMRPVVL